MENEDITAYVLLAVAFLARWIVPVLLIVIAIQLWQLNASVISERDQVTKNLEFIQEGITGLNNTAAEMDSTLFVISREFNN